MSFTFADLGSALDTANTLSFQNSTEAILTSVRFIWLLNLTNKY